MFPFISSTEKKKNPATTGIHFKVFTQPRKQYLQAICEPVACTCCERIINIHKKKSLVEFFIKNVKL